VDVNMRWAVAQDLEEHERRVVNHHSWPQQFERYFIRIFA